MNLGACLIGGVVIQVVLKLLIGIVIWKNTLVYGRSDGKKLVYRMCVELKFFGN